ncbi:MAG: dTDP-4-dehydrorhamnose 3,5-epimerase family protein [Armatimonadetes bacterium]|nr:dTDP-4-dehydrorhamnose 3,5-epimerase [Armatimonadota bacterium]NOG91902.1 dTDP-4-dehydrorhamnose 3,5-epimerase family protein [Armatimonadota bacterium]
MDAERDRQPMPGVLLRRLTRYSDARGWLIEAFREDELPDWFRPVMGYVSLTYPGVARGPHEHAKQTDGFAFLSAKFRLYLWDNRPGGDKTLMTFDVGEEEPTLAIVPPGVVHAYKNVSNTDGYVLNFPDALYAGRGKSEPVDEFRHEADPDSQFRLPEDDA